MSSLSSERALLDEDYQRLLGFRSELRRFLSWSEQTAREAGLTPSLHQLLLVLRGRVAHGSENIMDAAALRALQAPIKERYKSDTRSAFITLKARGTLDDAHIACKVETGRALASEVYQWSKLVFGPTHRCAAVPGAARGAAPHTGPSG